MSLATLQERQTQLILQRSQGKDIVEQAERELGAIQFATQELKAQIKEQEAEAEDKELAAAAGPLIPSTQK
ncbi:hypothetical protein LCGC14_2212860 [marine sediment metagenome]|uniref:Uncharacterized protein n=1 Tax=marine sediment metagenome TaxID=412755 RepID=A0A0F9DDD8_9ZZZZ